MIKINNLSYAYPQKKAIAFQDFVCKKGEQWLILGQSGSGKTTLLHLIAGLMKAQKGSICIDTTDITTLKTKELDHFRGKNIGIVFQKHHFVAALSVEENLLLAQQLAGEKTSVARANELLAALNLTDKRKEKPYVLSQGEQQRVAIARALMNNPSLILADEPTSALDDTNCEEVIQLLENQAKNSGATLLIVTHDNRLKTRFRNQIILE
jgi:putative ABC transport system ATP-binding protein